MTGFDITTMLPKFLTRDRNGYALAKALQAGMDDFLAAVELGKRLIDDADAMPEWRLDELAWEYNIPYSYTASLEAKRGWVRDAYDLSRLYGTAEGIARYIGAYFDGAQVLEAADYGGSAYHYKVVLTGAQNVADTRWAKMAAEAVQNVRSVLDEMRCELPDIETNAQLYVGAALYGAVEATLTNMEQPDVTSETWLGDENGVLLADENGVGMTE